MPRAFDSGLPTANRTVVRNRVFELLTPLLRGNSYMAEGGTIEVAGFLRAIVKLDAPIESYGEGEDLNRLYASLLGRAPAILIATGDRDLKPAGMGGFKHTSALEVHLYFLSNHRRSLLARVEADVVATGDAEADPPVEQNEAADPGIDVAMQCAEELLIGQKLDTTTAGGVIKHLELKRERALYTSAKHTLWTQMYLVGVTRSINPLRASSTKLVGIDTLLHPPGDPDPEAPDSVPFQTELTTP